MAVFDVRSRRRLALTGCALACSLLPACERSPAVVIELPHDASLAPVVLVPPPEPPGITEFDCTGTEPGQSTQSLRTWKSSGAAGAAHNLKGHALACDVTLRSDCEGQAELRVSAGLARSEKVVTAVAPGKGVSVQLRIASGLWEKALEPEDRAPYQETLQLVARAEVRCAAPVQDPRPRYWTHSFITGLMGDRPRPAAPAEPAVAVKDAPAGGGEGEGDSEPATKPTAAPGTTKSAPAPTKPTPSAAATATKASTASERAAAASERAAARAARRERKKNATPQIDLNLHPPSPASAEVEPAAPETEE